MESCVIFIDTNLLFPNRTNFITSHTSRKIRIVGLSTALANAKDLANWLGIGEMGLFNFKPSVRPVPLSVHISGFPGKHYCPRMATMNRPAFQAIRQYSPCTPALIFVASRRQTRITALDLIAFLAGEDNPKQFLHLPEDELDQILMNIKDNNLKLTLAFGKFCCWFLSFSYSNLRLRNWNASRWLAREGPKSLRRTFPKSKDSNPYCNINTCLGCQSTCAFSHHQGNRVLW